MAAAAVAATDVDRVEGRRWWRVSARAREDRMRHDVQPRTAESAVLREGGQMSSRQSPCMAGQCWPKDEQNTHHLTTRDGTSGPPPSWTLLRNQQAG